GPSSPPTPDLAGCLQAPPLCSSLALTDRPLLVAPASLPGVLGRGLARALPFAFGCFVRRGVEGRNAL
ncbi:MAG TPA: hypothetical protein VH540_05335, partial [Ktedonobacterales bacterium]